MAYGVGDKATALKMYLDGKSVTEISKILGITYHNVLNWSKEDDWARKKEKVVDKLQEAVIEDLVAYKRKKITELEGMVSFLLKEMENSKNPTKDKLANSIVELQKLILGIQGISVDSKNVKVEHEGKINLKLEDLL
jgi:uncharacterized protein YjcR